MLHIIRSRTLTMQAFGRFLWILCAFRLLCRNTPWLVTYAGVGRKLSLVLTQHRASLGLVVVLRAVKNTPLCAALFTSYGQDFNTRFCEARNCKVWWSTGSWTVQKSFPAQEKADSLALAANRERHLDGNFWRTLRNRCPEEYDRIIDSLRIRVASWIVRCTWIHETSNYA